MPQNHLFAEEQQKKVESSPSLLRLSSKENQTYCIFFRGCMELSIALATQRSVCPAPLCVQMVYSVYACTVYVYQVYR
jgi:hypothetical protein